MIKMSDVFDNEYKCITTDTKKVVQFCDDITKKTNIQICTPKGQMYEYLPNVCRSVVNQH